MEEGRIGNNVEWMNDSGLAVLPQPPQWLGSHPLDWLTPHLRASSHLLHVVPQPLWVPTPTRKIAPLFSISSPFGWATLPPTDLYFKVIQPIRLPCLHLLNHVTCYSVAPN